MGKRPTKDLAIFEVRHLTLLLDDVSLFFLHSDSIVQVLHLNCTPIGFKTCVKYESDYYFYSLFCYGFFRPSSLEVFSNFWDSIPNKYCKNNDGSWKMWSSKVGPSMFFFSFIYGELEKILYSYRLNWYLCDYFFSHLNFQSGSFFNSGETYINNFCKISKAQQIEVAQLFELVEQKWMIVQQNFCHGVNIEYPHFNLNTLFDGIITKGSNAPINGLASQCGYNFWQYVEQGFATGAKSIMGIGHLVYR